MYKLFLAVYSWVTFIANGKNRSDCTDRLSWIFLCNININGPTVIRDHLDNIKTELLKHFTRKKIVTELTFQPYLLTVHLCISSLTNLSMHMQKNLTRRVKPIPHKSLHTEQKTITRSPAKFQLQSRPKQLNPKIFSRRQNPFRTLNPNRTKQPGKFQEKPTPQDSIPPPPSKLI